MFILKTIYTYLYTTKSVKLLGQHTFYINEKLLSLKIVLFEINTLQKKTLPNTKSLNKQRLTRIILFFLILICLLILTNLYPLIFNDYSFQRHISILLFFL